jgi:iron-sulfur cluster assembly protein
LIQLTETAAKNFKRIREDEELNNDVPLRVAVNGGGCAGYEYVLTFDKPNKKDLTFESKGVYIVVDKKSHIVIDGVVIEWSTDLSAPGPRFQNPRAASTCGCSTSFSIKSVEVNSQPVWMQ